MKPFLFTDNDFIYGDRNTLTDKTKYIGYNFYVLTDTHIYHAYLDEKYETWCKDNYNDDDWCHENNGSIWFRDLEDLMAFRLRWS